MTDISSLNEEKLRQIVAESHSWMDVIAKCGLKTITRSLQRRLVKYKIDCSHFESFFDGKYTKFNRYTKEEIEEVVKSSDTWQGIMTSFKYTSCVNVPQVKAKLDKLEIDYSHVDPNYSRCKMRHRLEDILVKDSKYAGMPGLKRRLKHELGWEHVCAVCKLTEWNGREIPLQIDHINGDHWDNTITNLRFLCPNCHAQTDTYCGKNMKVYKKKKLNGDQPVSTARSHEQSRKVKFVAHCEDCNKGLNKKNTRCLGCYKKFLAASRADSRPTYQQLQDDLKEMSMVKVGEKYGVSDNAVRKWIKSYMKTNSLKL